MADPFVYNVTGERSAATADGSWRTLLPWLSYERNHDLRKDVDVGKRY